MEQLPLHLHGRLRARAVQTACHLSPWRYRRAIAAPGTARVKPLAGASPSLSAGFAPCAACRLTARHEALLRHLFAARREPNQCPSSCRSAHLNSAWRAAPADWTPTESPLAGRGEGQPSGRAARSLAFTGAWCSRRRFWGLETLRSLPCGAAVPPVATPGQGWTKPNAEAVVVLLAHRLVSRSSLLLRARDGCCCIARSLPHDAREGIARHCGLGCQCEVE